MMCIALQHDLNVLHHLLTYGSGTCHFVSNLFSSFLQLKIQKYFTMYIITFTFYNADQYKYKIGI